LEAAGRMANCLLNSNAPDASPSGKHGELFQEQARKSKLGL